MPFTIRDVSKHTKKATTGRLRRQWVAVANQTLEACRKKGGGRDCDVKAITVANGVVAGQVSEGLLQEAATIKSQAQRLLRDITAILEDRELPAALRKEIEDVRVALRKTWSDLAADGANTEAETMPSSDIAEVTKTVGGVSYPASDFLVTEDPESPSTWHLQVKKNGKVDRRLMGAAKAALTAPGGHRGQKYDGPGKQAAIAKLKALYKAEEMPWGEADADAECYGEEPGPAPIYGATSFADLMAARQANDAANQVRWLVTDFQNLVFACMGNPDVPDKLAAIGTITDEFMGLVEEALGGAEPEGEAECAECAAEFEDQGEAVALARDATAEDTAILGEAETKALGNGRRAPVVVEAQILKPGPGNKKDGRYYPVETVERDIHVFQGADVFATDHRETERSERTKVGKVIKVPTRFTAERAAVGEVLIYDPDQAEKARNRNDAHVLETMEFSIFGTGRSREGKINGNTYKVVEALTEGLYLELVSKAGAGGHALALAESEVGTMPDQVKPQPAATGGTQTQPEPETPAPVQETAISESGTPAAETQATPAALAEAEVLGALNASALPAADRALMARIAWKDAADLAEAITARQAYVKELSGSGKPTGLGGGQTAPQPAEISEADRVARFNSIMDEIGARPVPVPSGKGV